MRVHKYMDDSVRGTYWIVGSIIALIILLAAAFWYINAVTLPGTPNTGTESDVPSQSSDVPANDQVMPASTDASTSKNY
jgi:hypothetical protein